VYERDAHDMCRSHYKYITFSEKYVGFARTGFNMGIVPFDYVDILENIYIT
jgi:hypothetical protein